MCLHLRMTSSAIFSGSDNRSSSVFSLKRLTSGVRSFDGGSLVSKWTTMATSSLSASINPGWTLRFVRVSFSSSSSRRGILVCPGCPLLSLAPGASRWRGCREPFGGTAVPLRRPPRLPSARARRARDQMAGAQHEML